MPSCRRGPGASGRELAHDAVKRRLPLEADAGPVGEPQTAVLEHGIVGEAAELPEYTGIGFGAAEAEAAGDRGRRRVAAMRNQARARPAAAIEHRHGLRVLHDAVGLRRVDLDDVAARGLEPAEAHEVLYVLGREQVLAGGKRRRVDAGDLREQRKSQGVARALPPPPT